MPRKLTLSDLIRQGLTAPDLGAAPVDPYATARQGYVWATEPIPQLQPAIESLGRIPVVGPALQMGAELLAPSYADLMTAGMSRVGKMLSGGADTLADLARLTAYHGTPHQFPPAPDNPLGAFDPSKIGTGEGSQMYGYGHYLAEHPMVAEQYAGVRRSGPTLSWGTTRYAIPDQAVSELMALTPPTSASTDFAEGFKEYLYRLGDPSDDYNVTPDYVRDLVLKNAWRHTDNVEAYTQGVMDAVRQAAPVLKKTYPVGSLYTVDVPDAIVDKLVDWNEPFTKQPQAFQDLVSRMTPRFQDPHVIARSTAGEAYEALATHLDSEALASEMLRKAGIPGFKYLDAGSRASGKGTRNFVVFPGEEPQLKILKRE